MDISYFITLIYLMIEYTDTFFPFFVFHIIFSFFGFFGGLLKNLSLIILNLFFSILISSHILIYHIIGSMEIIDNVNLNINKFKYFMISVFIYYTIFNIISISFCIRICMTYHVIS